MGVVPFLSEYRAAVELVYALLVIVPSLLVFAWTWRLYRFSRRHTVKWFSLSFAAFAAAFAVRYAAMLYLISRGADPLATVNEVILPFLVMEFFAALPGFLFVYSLTKRELPAARPWMLFAGSFLVAALDGALQSFTFLYTSQVILFSVGSWVSWQRFARRRSGSRLAFAWTVTVLLVVWVANAAGQYAIDEAPWVRLPVYLLTVAGTWSFLFIVRRLLSRGEG